ncbi:MAG: phage tail protein [Kurthia sp.]|nr:phage tail protein [Candidatus Kurthia equi]
MSENKVAFGLKNVHYAPITVGEDGLETYEVPKRYPGAVELTLDPKGELSEFYADDTVYYSASTNQGYEGTFNAAEAPEQFRINVLGEKLIGGLLVEDASIKPKPVALLFEFDGDVKATRHTLYNVTFSRPGLTSKTKEDATEVATNELSFMASPRAKDSRVKVKTSSTTTDEIYSKWYTAVQEAVPTV